MLCFLLYNIYFYYIHCYFPLSFYCRLCIYNLTAFNYFKFYHFSALDIIRHTVYNYIDKL